MRSVLRRRALLQAGAVGLGAALLPPARACEFHSPNLRIVHPWARASATGTTVASLCMTFDEVRRSDRLIGVSTPVAGGAELAGGTRGTALDLVIPADRTTVLSEDDVHIRLVDLTHPLETGRTYPLRLQFADGGIVAASISVDYERLF